MPNQTVKFVSADGLETLVVSMNKGKRDYAVTFRHKKGSEKVKGGPREYFEVGAEGEAKATERFNLLVRDAEGAGWKRTETTKRSSGLSSIPLAPGAERRASSPPATPPQNTGHKSDKKRS